LGGAKKVIVVKKAGKEGLNLYARCLHQPKKGGDEPGYGSKKKGPNPKEPAPVRGSAEKRDF